MSLRGRTDKIAPSLGTMQVLVVACGKTYLAIPGAVVRGVVEFGEAVEARIVSLFGETCRVTDLAARLGLPPAVLTPDMRIILCGEHRARQAWRVDRTLGLEDVDMQRITPLPPHFAGVEQSWFTGLFLFRDTVALLINSGWLLSQTMDVFVAQSLSEQAVSEEPRAIAQSSAAQTGEAGMAASAEEPAPARKKARRKPSAAAVGEDAALEVLENLVLEESADAEDSQTPWADT
ncbi:MAG TPA: chemotaxis protein CheW [Nitrospiraceae bacterium]|nr:chemotaxis protein CheW [Nitrospiraceae bacterium]